AYRRPSCPGKMKRAPERTIKFRVVVDTEDECLPAEILRHLMDSNRLQNFQKRWGRSTGDCHEMALALILDLADNRAPGTRFWYMGACPRIGDQVGLNATAGRLMR